MLGERHVWTGEWLSSATVDEARALNRRTAARAADGIAGHSPKGRAAVLVLRMRCPVQWHTLLEVFFDGGADYGWLVVVPSTARRARQAAHVPDYEELTGTPIRESFRCRCRCGSWTVKDEEVLMYLGSVPTRPARTLEVHPQPVR